MNILISNALAVSHHSIANVGDNYILFIFLINYTHFFFFFQYMHFDNPMLPFVGFFDIYEIRNKKLQCDSQSNDNC